MSNINGDDLKHKEDPRGVWLGPEAWGKTFQLEQEQNRDSSKRWKESHVGLSQAKVADAQLADSARKQSAFKELKMYYRKERLAVRF